MNNLIELENSTKNNTNFGSRSEDESEQLMENYTNLSSQNEDELEDSIESYTNFDSQSELEELIKNIIDFDPKIKNKYNALMLVCDQNKLIKLLIDKGADVNFRYSFQDTILMIQCNKDKVDIEIIRTLIENGANVNLQN